MVKKAVKNQEVSKVSSNKGLVENFVSLQKVMTNLSVRFDELSNQISKLLELFELSAAALAKKDINFTKPMDEDKIINKLNNILEQNKIIARGMALMGEGREPEKIIQPAMPQFRQSPAPSPITKGEERYQKSPFKGF
ncbi:hypothetical protein HYS72_00655 [Candidatus Pacearchaeota archaeon]|nr:hypothetical protein [Candidatus Pacearchaeota archaeon]